MRNGRLLYVQWKIVLLAVILYVNKILAGERDFGEFARPDGENGAIELFKYDAMGNVTEKKTTYDGDTTHAVTVTYSYDSITGRLMNDGTSAYTYDLLGNLTSKTSTGAKIEYIYNLKNKLISAETRVTKTSVLMTLVNKSLYRYDAFGNRVYRSFYGTEGEAIASLCIYDTQGNKVFEKMKKGANPVESWFLVTMGLLTVARIKKEADSFETDGNHVIQTVKAEDIVFNHYDYLGSLRTQTNGSGGLLSARSYLAYGETADEWTKDGAEQPEEGFSFYSWDAESQMYYARNRYYLPEVGRFNAVDSARDGFNYYIYCDDLPVDAVDPLGLKAEQYDSGTDLTEEEQKKIDIFLDKQEQQIKEQLIAQIKSDALAAAIKAFDQWLKAHPGDVLNALKAWNEAYATTIYDEFAKNVAFNPSMTASDQQKFKNDILYLLQTERGTELILNITAGLFVSGLTLVIEKTTAKKGNSTGLTDDGNSPMITWNPDACYKVIGKNGIMSPALALAHELGHIEQAILGTSGTEAQIENDVIVNTEAVIGAQLKELGYTEAYRDKKTWWGYAFGDLVYYGQPVVPFWIPRW